MKFPDAQNTITITPILSLCLAQQQLGKSHQISFQGVMQSRSQYRVWPFTVHISIRIAYDEDAESIFGTLGNAVSSFSLSYNRPA